VSPRPLIFISAVSRELKSARQLVANTLIFLGYQPAWQDIFGTETGDLRSLLRQQIDQCKGVVQLVGQCYGAEPPIPDEEFGRSSYTQYEALYARKRGKKVWYLFIDETFPIDAHEPEPEELQELQAIYRRRLQADTHLYHPLTSSEGLEAGVLKLRDDLTRLRRGVKQWATGVAALLILITALIIWLVHAQRHQTGLIQKQGEQVSAIVDRYQKMQQALVRLADVEAHSKQPGSKSSPEEQRANAYGVLERELGLPAGSLAKELPGFALELYNRSDTTPLIRARAAYALGRFDEAERLSLQGAAQDRQGYESAQRVQEERRKSAIEGYELAGQSAQKRIHYAVAMEHFREAEKLTDRDHNPEQWALVQDSIGNLLNDQGEYHDAEDISRNVAKVIGRVLGPDHPETLKARNAFVNALVWEGKNAEAEAECREIIKLEEKVLGPEHPDTLKTLNRLATTLDYQARYPEAEPEYRRVLELREKLLGPEDADTLGSRSNLAVVLMMEGKYRNAENEFSHVIKLEGKVLGPEHPSTLMDRMNLAEAFRWEGKYAQSEAECRQVVQLKNKVLGPEHPETLVSRNNLTNVLNSLGNYAESETECRLLLTLEEKRLGPEHPYTIDSHHNLANALRGQKKYAAAEAEFRQLLPLEEKTAGPEHPDTLESFYDLGLCLSERGETKEATAFARRAAEGARKILGPNHPSTQKYEKLWSDLEAKR
jgi:tetratricopeptide (TPR) repeat protein